MLRSVKALYGDKLGASDGDLGSVKDFYFDDTTWALRYLIADTGSWLSGRQVLIAPHCLGSLDRTGERLLVNLTRQQIEGSPLIEEHKPVSRQFEELYYRYYGLPYYWQGDGIWGMASFPLAGLPPTPVVEGPEAVIGQHHADFDPHLRSAQAVEGYHLQAIDGPIGYIADFMMDDTDWVIRQLVIKTGGWFSGKEVLIPTSAVDRISYPESLVYVNWTQAIVRARPEPADAAPVR